MSTAGGGCGRWLQVAKRHAEKTALLMSAVDGATKASRSGPVLETTVPPTCPLSEHAWRWPCTIARCSPTLQPCFSLTVRIS